MTEKTKVSGGNTDQASGNDQDKNKQQNTVAYESFAKALDEKKRAQAKSDELQRQLDEIQNRAKIEEETKLKEKGEFQKLLELREQKVVKLEEQLKMAEDRASGAERAVTDTWKLSHFYEKLPGKLKNKEYLTFVPLEDIVLNPETKDVDTESLDKVVNTFMEKHGHLVEKQSKGRLPGDAANGTVSTLSYEQWKKLPLKEKKEKYHQVFKSKHGG